MLISLSQDFQDCTSITPAADFSLFLNFFLLFHFPLHDELRFSRVDSTNTNLTVKLQDKERERETIIIVYKREDTF